MQVQTAWFRVYILDKYSSLGFVNWILEMDQLDKVYLVSFLFIQLYYNNLYTIVNFY